MSTQQLKQKGFTIIEVVLVLAIAALILLMVFIALPALQRNQRDPARKTVLGKVASAVTTYQSNNRGAQPANGDALSKYVDGSPTGTSDTIIDNEYTVTVTGIGSVTPPSTGAAAVDTVQVITGAKCNDANQAIAGTTRNAAVIIQMENGEAYVCQTV